MTVPRALALSRMTSVLQRNLLSSHVQKGLVLKQQVRNSGGEYSYRKVPDAPKGAQRYADIMGGIFWWWVLWHAFTDYEEFLYPVFPNPSTFTDEELGIPPLN